MNVVLISTYELGRQPFGLASPAAWLKEAGASVTCLDLAVQPLSDGEDEVASADLVAFYVPMHTATRIAASVVGQIRRINPSTHLCFYGLYASVNEGFLRELGADSILGGEFEQRLVDLVKDLEAGGRLGEVSKQPDVVSLGRQQFRVPDRSGLPALARYAHVSLPSGKQRVVGYTEATRGCKHLCRHCPIVPVYGGSFRVVQRDVVLRDIELQVAAGAEHITFGDPDFFNGPAHALAIVRELHERYPEVTYDVTIKVEHLLVHAEHLPALRDTGCLFVTSAVESIDSRILEFFDKRHTQEEFRRVVEIFREVGLTLNPTFVTFTPWTTLRGYVDLLTTLFELDLVDNVAPIQYAIRLLIPTGSKLLELPETQAVIGEYNQASLSYPWMHPDPAVDELYHAVMAEIRAGQANGESRRAIFQRVWCLAQRAYDSSVIMKLDLAQVDQAPPRSEVPYLTEPWYC
ncbi:MAG TPA: CUAEP/CCAEP-tail radical SAM protein [Thermoanaerobaculia bacterium]|nr:CUAEP/CCAEP-tail radical SAM protein [Thermoanaerobaculia bacterium]